MGAVNRVVDGLAVASGLGRGLVIAGFVVGLASTPLLTAVVFFATLYWVTYPDEARGHFDRFSAFARRAAERLSDVAFAPRRQCHATTPDYDEPNEAHPAPQTPSPSPMSSARLRERFEALERRAKSIEAFVASEEYRLEREFKRIDGE